jgi:hypothetical protein
MSTLGAVRTRSGGGLALAAGLVAVVLTGFTLPSLLPGLVGLLGIGVGVWQRSQRVLTLGVLGVFTAIVVAGTHGAGPVRLLGATVGLVVAWDSAENALTLGEQLGSRSASRRPEIVHAGTTAFVTALGAAGVYGVFRFATGGQPVVALFALLIGALLILGALGH